MPNPRLPILDALAYTPFFRGYGEGGILSGDHLGVDRWMRLFGYVDLARNQLPSLSDRSQMIVHAFVDGVNHFFSRRGDEAEPYEAATELAWWSCYEHVISVGFFISNAFALGAGRTSDGSSWVGGDPHYWFFDGHSEAHVVAPELDLNGVWDGHVNLGMWGGSNSSIATNLTAAGLEGATVYRERLNPDNRGEYCDWRIGDFRPFEARTHLLKVAGGEAEAFVARRTQHGPVVAESLDDESPAAFAVRSPFHEEPAAALDQQLQMWTASTVDEFIELAKNRPSIRGHRVVADREGNIGYVCNGPLAVRSDGFDWSGPVDGSVPETEWSERRWVPGATEYGLPAYVNPSSGFIQSANDAPWFSSAPAPCGRDFPEYVFRPGWRALGVRGARLRELLSDTGATSELEVPELLLDVFVPRAYYGIRALRRALQEGAAEAPALSPDAAALDALLAAWDGSADAESEGMSVAFHLHRALADGIPAPEITPSEDLQGIAELAEPRVGPADAAAYARALEEVASKLLSLYGTLLKPWGEIHVLERPGGAFQLPGGANGLKALFGTWRGWWWDDSDEVDLDGVERCNFGSRTIRATNLSHQGIAVYSIVLTGQGPATEHPDSPHVLDQAQLYRQRQLKRSPLTRAEVEAAAREEDHRGCLHAHREAIYRPL